MHPLSVRKLLEKENMHLPSALSLRILHINEILHIHGQLREISTSEG